MAAVAAVAAVIVAAAVPAAVVAGLDRHAVVLVANVLAGLVGASTRLGLTTAPLGAARSSCRTVTLAVGIVWLSVGLLAAPRLETVPASATPAISRTPPMIAAILYMPFLLRSMSYPQVGRGPVRGGQRRAKSAESFG